MSRMKHSLKFGFMLCFLAIPLLLSVSKASLFQVTHKPSGSSDRTNVGMVPLLAEPEKYNGRFIRTIGFACFLFETDGLYLHEEDFRRGLTKNALALRISESQRKQFKDSNLKYVLIEGTLYANGPEATDIWAGAIGHITRLEIWPVDNGANLHQ